MVKQIKWVKSAEWGSVRADNARRARSDAPYPRKAGERFRARLFRTLNAGGEGPGGRPPGATSPCEVKHTGETPGPLSALFRFHS